MQVKLKLFELKLLPQAICPFSTPERNCCSAFSTNCSSERSWDSIGDYFIYGGEDVQSLG